MTNKINGIDVNECPCKDDDKCLEVPILNEYGDLIDYQDCEPQTLCPYRSKIKIKRLQEENKELYEKNVQLQKENEELKKIFKKIDKLLDEALDSEVTDMEQSLDRLYTISEMIGKVLNDRD